MISDLNGNSSEQQNLDVSSMNEHNGRLTYNDFANRSIKTLENNLEIQNKLFKPIKDTLAKFLDCRNAQAFYKFERELEESEREHLNLLSRLKKNDFEVIFVGAEKAGKSSLINSYLNCPDMLPTGIGRCTYTEIEILPSEKVDEELIVIEYFNQNEFEEIIKINQSLLEECDPEKESHLIALKAEKRELESCRNDENFCELLRKVKEEKKFKKSDLEEAKKLLNDQVADVKNSRALKSIKIYTSRFLMKNVLIYDLPGFDSPTKIHKDLAIKRCKSADAIVYVKDSLRPSLPLHEIEMLDTFKNIDLLIPFEEKLILALTNIDRINNLNDYHLTLQTTEKEWKKYKLSKDRIAKVSNEF